MIVLTGGPCSGKSSSLAYLTEKLSDHGFMVFVVPETATLITNNGIDRRRMDKTTQVAAYEETILEMQLAFEETYTKAVKRIFPEKRKVIILDRGVMDIKAFVSKDDFRSMLKRKGLSEVRLRDRYLGVVHLVTAADGAEAYYTSENNTARLESREEAIELDRKTRESWLGHPRLKIIDNKTDFDGKIRRVFNVISQLLGIPASTAAKERYVVAPIQPEQLPTYQVVEIEQIYLRSRSREEEIHIRKRGYDGSYLYFLRRSSPAPQSMMSEELIDEQQFLNLRKLIDPRTEPLVKDRFCFLWDNRYFELDKYGGRHQGLWVLGAEPTESNDAAPGLPFFVSVKKKVTGIRQYEEKRMAVRKT